jgi:hypothetical protein
MSALPLVSRSGRGLGVLFMVIVLISAGLPPDVAVAQGGQGRGLGKHDRELLAQAVARGDATVPLLIAAQPGAMRNVVSGITALGGTVRYRDDDVSYLRVVVPTAQVDPAARLSGVEAANLDELIPLDNPKQAAGTATASIPPPGPATPAENPYLPTRDIGAPQFVAAHPTFDGRGVKIGILDSGVDLLIPELQTAKLLDGTPTRKIVDWVNVNDPLEGFDATWVNMQDQVTAGRDGAFTYKGVSYRAPAAGSYRIGLFDERNPRLGSEFARDVNRDGNPPGSSGIFAVLWDTAPNTVWVDTNQNHSFADEKAMTDYKVRYDVGVFGTDNPATPIRESVPFVVQTDGQHKYVNVGIVSSSHGTAVAGAAAGKAFFGGAMNGAAPEAQLVVAQTCVTFNFCTAHGLIEGAIYLEKQANVDVINISIGGLAARNDGNSVRSRLYNRLIEQYKAQIFIAAGNTGPGLNTVWDPADGTKAIGVGGYYHKDSQLSLIGAVVPRTEGVFALASRGPREDGGFKPDLLASFITISTDTPWQPSITVPGTYTLPPGYSAVFGTSLASPQVAGGAALLISAAKQSNVQWKPVQLRQAIKSSARFLAQDAAHEQGNGLMQVGGAWELLKTSIKTVEIASQAPVNTVLSRFLVTPNQGPGLYEREGWTAGQSAQRTITFTRTSGGAPPVTYRLVWIGNDGTFSSASSIDLPLNVPVPLSVGVRPATAGAHSAILNLDDPGTAGVDYQLMATVIAAEQLNAANGFTGTRSASVTRATAVSIFFNVPSNTPILKIDLNAANADLQLQRFDPSGLPVDGPDSPFQTGPQSRTIARPASGVWEVAVGNSVFSPGDAVNFSLTATLYGVDVSPPAWITDPARVGTMYNSSITFTNRFGAFTGAATGTALANSFASRPTVAAGGPPQLYTLDVPAGSSRISARISNASDASADLDLYLFDCTTASCVLRATSLSPTATESVSVANPATGRWIVLVDPFAVPSGSTLYDYVDLIANPAFGAVSVNDPSALHPSGDTWTRTAGVTAQVLPAAGRFFQGSIQVNIDGTIAGSAEVDLKNVGP